MPQPDGLERPWRAGSFERPCGKSDNGIAVGIDAFAGSPEGSNVNSPGSCPEADGEEFQRPRQGLNVPHSSGRSWPIDSSADAMRNNSHAAGGMIQSAAFEQQR